MTGYQTITAEALERKGAGQGVIVDVRTQMEHDEKHLGLPHAHVPLDVLNPRDFMARHGLDRDADVYVLCRSGNRAKQAAEKFVAAGFGNIHVIEGGLMGCEECGYEVKGQQAAPEGMASSSCSVSKGKGTIPLERQVRIAAGLIAGMGALLALIVHPVYALIPLFVGGGLVFAGVTDRCGMALVLTKAPWNKAAAPASCGLKPSGSMTKTGSCS